MNLLSLLRDHRHSLKSGQGEENDEEILKMGFCPKPKGQIFNKALHDVVSILFACVYSDIMFVGLNLKKVK